MKDRGKRINELLAMDEQQLEAIEISLGIEPRHTWRKATRAQLIETREYHDRIRAQKLAQIKDLF